MNIQNKETTEGLSYLAIAERLYAAGIGDTDTCKYEAAILLEHFCGVHRAMLPLRKTELFSSDELLEAVNQRCDHYPLQYLIGEWQFCTETYTVTPDCLIPRMDSEILVETGDILLPENGRFIDLCTGSGCIAVSLLSARPDAHGVAAELYPNTLSLAEKNAERNGVHDRLVFCLADVLKPDFMEELGEFDLIVSNPPYIPTDVVETLSPEVKHEPHAALDGGDDGLLFYRVFVRDYPKYLKTGGAMAFEIGYDEGDALRTLAEEAGMHCEIRKDLSGNDRVAVLTRKT